MVVLVADCRVEFFVKFKGTHAYKVINVPHKVHMHLMRCGPNKKRERN